MALLSWSHLCTCVQGAEAFDSVEGDRSSQVTACSPDSFFDKHGLQACTFSTAEPGNHTLAYTLLDTATGVEHVVQRTLVVSPDCSGDESACTSLQCSVGRLCTSGTPLGTPFNGPPLLRFAGAAKSAVKMPRGTAFMPCSQQRPYDTAECEAGAVAVDPEDGNLSASVLACPPEDCMWRGCPGHEFRRKGVTTSAVCCCLWLCASTHCCYLAGVHVHWAPQLCAAVIGIIGKTGTAGLTHGSLVSSTAAFALGTLQDVVPSIPV